MPAENQDIIISNVNKIRTYAELMCNVSSEMIEFDGSCMVRIGAEIIESLNKIVETIHIDS